MAVYLHSTEDIMHKYHNMLYTKSVHYISVHTLQNFIFCHYFHKIQSLGYDMSKKLPTLFFDLFSAETMVSEKSPPKK